MAGVGGSGGLGLFMAPGMYYVPDPDDLARVGEELIRYEKRSGSTLEGKPCDPPSTAWEVQGDAHNAHVGVEPTGCTCTTGPSWLAEPWALTIGYSAVDPRVSAMVMVG